MISIIRAAFICLALVVLLPAFAQQDLSTNPIATLALARGTVTARSLDDQVRELEKGSAIYVGDVITTATRSFAVVEFVDDSKVTLQPNSELDVEEFEATVGEESIVLELLKGGLRALSGQIGKRQPEKVRFRARSSTIGIRGTTLAIRLCNVGTLNCEFRRAVTETGLVESNDAGSRDIRIFERDNNVLDAERRPISRQEYAATLGDTYAWLIEGKIIVTTASRVFELETGRECLPGELAQTQFPNPSEQQPCTAPENPNNSIPPLQPAKPPGPPPPNPNRNKLPQQPKSPKR